MDSIEMLVRREDVLVELTNRFICSVALLYRVGNPPNFWVGFGFLQNPPKNSGLIRGLQILVFCRLRIFELWIANFNNSLKVFL